MANNTYTAKTNDQGSVEVFRGSSQAFNLSKEEVAKAQAPHFIVSADLDEASLRAGVQAMQCSTGKIEKEIEKIIAENKNDHVNWQVKKNGDTRIFECNVIDIDNDNDLDDAKETVAKIQQLVRELKSSIQVAEEARFEAEHYGKLLNDMNTVYGNTVRGENVINELTRNVGGYGGGLSALVYPSDLVSAASDGYGVDNYGGCYTAFFISEHSKSDAGQLRSMHATRLTNAAGSGLANMFTPGSILDKAYANYGEGITGFIGGAVVTKLAQEAMRGIGLTGASVRNTKAELAAEVISKAVPIAVGATGFATSLANDVNIFENNTQYNQLKVAIVLPTPVIKDSHKLEWSDESTAVGAGFAQFVANRGQENGQNAAGKRNATLSEDIKGATESLMLGTLQAGIGSTIKAVLRKASNPRKEQLFKDVHFREFSMEWTLAARSADELKNIESIIRVFKYHAYPELTQGNWLWIYPAHFDIVHYFHHEINLHMPRHATCVLRDITVDYGGDTFTVRDDGSPTIIKLHLDFVELAVLSRANIKDGY